MRLGLMIGSDKERARGDRLAGVIEDAKSADAAGFSSFWIPQVPGYLDAMTAVALAGAATQRIELGTAIVPLQTRHPIAFAQQALTTHVACSGRFAVGVGPSHHWIISDQLGLPYDRPAHLVRDYLEVLNAAFTPGSVDVENDSFRVHSPMDVSDPGAPPILLAALGPAMLRIAGEHASGTILWMADERAVEDHVVPRITDAATLRGPPGASCGGGSSRRPVRDGRDRRCPQLRERGAGARRLLTQLRAAARTRGRRGRRRHDGRR